MYLEDIEELAMVWPCGTWAWDSEYSHDELQMSDDYITVPMTWDEDDDADYNMLIKKLRKNKGDLE